MTDMDKLFESAASETRSSIRPIDDPDPSSISRRASRRIALVAGMVVALLGLGTAGLLAVVSTNNPLLVGDTDSLITSEMILEDGVVTEEEYRAGAEAVVVCLTDAGFEAAVDFDDLTRHASFSSSGGLADNDAFFACEEKHLSYNVSLGWSAALGQVDLKEERERIVATFGCVEAQTGLDFGDVVYDEFNFRTEQGQQSYNAAFEHEDHGPWLVCNNQLGYEAEVQAETEALLECVETKTGEDFGELSYDPETGHLTQEALEVANAAFHYDDDKTWAACQKELGFWPYNSGRFPNDFGSGD